MRGGISGRAEGDDGELELLEAFALADDRAAVVEERTVPGSEERYHYTCLRLQHEGRLDEVPEVLQAWRTRHPYSSRLEGVVDRQALLSWERDPAATLARVRERLGLSFHHQREVEGERTDHPTALDPGLVTERAWLELGWSHSAAGDLGGFTDAALVELAGSELDPHRRRALLSRLRRPDVEGLVELVALDLEQPPQGASKHAFGALRIHGLLLEEQLVELAERVPGVAHHTEYVNARLRRLQPGPGSSWEHDPLARGEHLERLWRFVAPLPASFGSLRAHVLFHLLEQRRARGIADRELLIQYLELPRHSPHTALEQGARRRREPPVDLSADFRALTLLPPVGDDEELVLALLVEVLRDAPDTAAFEGLLRGEYLRRALATSRLLHGAGEPERWAGLLDDPGAYQALRDRVELTLLPTNPALFAGDAPVALEVDTKNVPTLVVKVFEVNTLNYYLARGREVDASLDLDGLVPTWERTFELSEPPIRRVRRRIEVPGLERPGVFVVELQGNGRSSRALIRKGNLRYVERVGAAGQVLTVIDEAGRPVRDAVVWLGGRELRARPDGTVLVPFSTAPRRQTILLRAGDVTAIEELQHRDERYAFSCGIHVEREALLARAQAQVLVRPSLTLHGTPVSLELVEEPTLAVTSLDRQGVSTTREVPGFALHADGESAHTIQVPEDLVRLEVAVRGRLRRVSDGQTEQVSAARSWELNGIERTDRTEALHLARTAAGWVLELRGKTGEPRGGAPVRVWLRHRLCSRERDVQLQTDAGGRVALGPLPGVLALRATSDRGGVEARWELAGSQARLPAAVHAPAGEVIELPYVGGAAGPERRAFSLLERRGGAFLACRREHLAVAPGLLRITGLPPGDHELLLEETGQQVAIRVVAGPLVAGWVAGRGRLLEVRPGPPLTIAAVDVTAEAVTVQLANPSRRTRVHLLATRYLPAHAPFAELDAVALAAAPQQVDAGVSPSSYVSGRDLGDEYRYVLERRYARRFPGTMLSRPGLLLNPWALRDTDSEVAEARGGDGYGAGARGEKRKEKALHERARAEAAPSGPFASLDFLPRPVVVLENLRPDERGQVRVARSALGDGQQLHVVALDGEGTVYREVGLPEVPLAPRDLRLLTGLDPAGHFVERRQVTCLRAGETLVVEDAAASRVELYDSLGRVFSLFTSLGGGGDLERFRFVLRWPELSEEEKRSKLSELACHELHLFIARKDPDFFARVVRPYLRNKRDRTFLDRWLLEDDLAPWLDPWAHGRLNTAERVLLGQRLAGQRAAGARDLADRLALRPPAVDREQHLFRSALQQGALEAEEGLLAGFAEQAEGGPGGAMLLCKADMSPPPPPCPAPGMRKRAASLDAFDTPAAEAEPCDDMLADECEEAPPEDQDLADRREAGRLYRGLQATQELAESNYWQRRVEEQGPELVPLNRFWLDLARHEGPGPFLSPHVAEASSGFTEMMLALAVLDLPFAAPAHDVTREGAGLRLVAGGPLIAFHRATAPVAPAARKAPLLVSQNYFRPDDRYRWEEGEQLDNYVGDELRTQTVYTCQVVLTNPTSSRQKLEVLLQLPRGAMPVSDGFRTRGVPLVLEPYATRSLEYSFYFPLPGELPHFPAHVARAEELVAHAAPVTLRVVEQPTRVDRGSWAWVSQHAPADEVLAFLERENVARLDLERVAWRLRERGFYERALPLLADRRVYHPTLWSYSVLHGDPVHLPAFLRHQDGFLRGAGPALRGGPLDVDPVERGWYEHREYAPLVHARAHPLGGRRRILNEGLAAQYRELLELLCHLPRLASRDRLAAAYYLFLQDRVADGLRELGRVEPDEVETRLQLDYLRAWAALFEGDLARSRGLAERHQDHPVDRWRRLFRAVLGHLDEAEGRRPAAVDAGDRDEAQTRQAALEPTFDFRIDDRTLRLSYQALTSCQVSYYLMDVELLFSRQPFVQQQADGFSFVRPNRSDRVELPAGRPEHAFELPAELQGSNLVVEVVAAGARRSRAHYAHRLVVQVSEGMGQLRVTHQVSGAPLAAVYVKVYARTRGGEVRFYKDGYTDLRGRFDYASLSTGDLDHTARFALLILSDQDGAVIREAGPPLR